MLDIVRAILPMGTIELYVYGIILAILISGLVAEIVDRGKIFPFKRDHTK